MNTKAFGKLALAAVLLVATLAVAGFAVNRGEGAELRRVETHKVCMVNDQVFEKDQIPVAVEGRTYYGCCEMCKERLARDTSARTAVDPVSGKAVDKAQAVIGARPDGSVLYFESEENLEAYREPAAG